ncbi:unnamed protein product [Parnassius apollo]|uniref:(apollo) hypothetical protein n=1 Tax=Parnassius apollo TaxID=110799 RepID=A0A8S3XHS9_PARAO|nr:unnamed protein product [Parnassius apollo]
MTKKTENTSDELLNTKTTTTESLDEVFATVKQERGVTSLVTALKKGKLEGRPLEFLPLNRRSEEVLASSSASRGLAELLRLHRAQASQEARRELTQALLDELADEKPVRDPIQELRDMAQ